MGAKYRISEDDYVNAMKLFSRLTLKQIYIYVAASLVLLMLAIFASPIIQSGAIGALVGGAYSWFVDGVYYCAHTFSTALPKI